MLRRITAWSLGLWRLAAGRIRVDWRFLVGVWLLLVSATTLLAAGVLYGDAVAVGSLRSAIRGAPITERGVSVRSTVTPQAAQGADPAVREAIATTLGRAARPVILVARSGSLVRGGGAAGQPNLTLLEGVDDPAAHAALVEGAWPRAGANPVEAAVSRAAAAALGVRVGDRVPLGDASVPGADPNHPIVTVVVVGIDEPIATDPVWLGDQLDLTGTATLSGPTFRGPFVVTPADLLLAGRFDRIDASWRATLDLDRLGADEVDALRGRIARLPEVVHGAFPAGGSVTVKTGLAAILDAATRSLQVARASVFLLTLQFAVVAVYAVLLVAGMLADRRRPEIGLLRSRGASTTHVVTLAFGEALLLSVPAAAAAPFLASGVVRLIGLVGPLAATDAVGGAAITPTVTAAVVAGGIVAAIVLTIPALTAGAEVAGIRAVLGRPLARTFAQRLGIDVALIAVAGLAIWQLRTYGAPVTRDRTGVLGLDPLLVAAPAVGLLAGGVLATRVVPRLGEAGEWLFERARGLVSPLGARQVARRPLRYTRAALLLMLSTALGTFGAVYASTWSASHADQASYQVGADVRVVPGPANTSPAWQMGSAYRAIDGVIGALPVARRELAVGRVVRNGVIVATDAAAASRIATLPGGPEADGLAPAMEALAAARPNVPGVALPAAARWIRVDLDANLTEVGPTFTNGEGQSVTITVPDDFRGIVITAIVQDGDGVISRFPMEPTAQAGLWRGSGQTLTVPLSTTRAAAPGGAPSDPRRLIGFEITLEDPFGTGFGSPIRGTFHITGLAASTDVAHASWQPMDAAPAETWSWLEQDQNDTVQTLATGLGPLTLPNSPEFAVGGAVSLRFVPPTPTDASVPTVASDALLAVAGSGVGDTIGARSAGGDVRLHVVGRTPEFPTILPPTPFAVVDGPTMDVLAYLADGSVPVGPEWWLSVEPGMGPAVAAALRAAPFSSATVVERSAVLASLQSDPIGLGTLGALVLGSIAAAAFAILGFLVGASVSTRERLGEFALLRALGLSGGQLTAWLAAEGAFLLAVGLIGGVAIGLLLGVLIVPETLLGPNGTTVVPVPRVVVPWVVLGGVVVGAIGLLVLTVGFVGRPLPGRRIAAVLRAAED